ncbi:hypothetical protein J6590_002709 [Homalodisca vitripennis]|nr:hypothetical protein J6590_002709 [Homalodisca vitripennis]
MHASQHQKLADSYRLSTAEPARHPRLCYNAAVLTMHASQHQKLADSYRLSTTEPARHPRLCYNAALLTMHASQHRLIVTDCRQLSQLDTHGCVTTLLYSLCTPVSIGNWLIVTDCRQLSQLDTHGCVQRCSTHYVRQSASKLADSYRLSTAEPARHPRLCYNAVVLTMHANSRQLSQLDTHGCVTTLLYSLCTPVSIRNWLIVTDCRQLSQLDTHGCVTTLFIVIMPVTSNLAIAESDSCC